MPTPKIKVVFRYWPDLLILRFCRQFSVDGIRLVVPGPARSRAGLLKNKVATALHLIKTHTPKYYARVQQFIPNILFSGAYPSQAVYISDLKLCDISFEFALAEGTTTEQMAMTLVHEATHGYLQSRGVIYEEERRAQIERICVRAEIAFASRLPQAGELVPAARQRLDYGPEYWTNASFIKRQAEFAAKVGIPRFLIRLLQRIQSRRWGNVHKQKITPSAVLTSDAAMSVGNQGGPQGPPSRS
jgi:hypothetical protein